MASKHMVNGRRALRNFESHIKKASADAKVFQQETQEIEIRDELKMMPMTDLGLVLKKTSAATIATF